MKAEYGTRMSRIVLLAVLLAMLVPAVGRDQDDAWACFAAATRLRALVFSPDGTMLAKADDDSTTQRKRVHLLDVTKGQEVSSFEGGPDIAFLPDGKKLITVGKRKSGGLTIRLVMAKTGVDVREFDVPVKIKETVDPALALSPDGQMLAAGINGDIRLIDVATGKERGKLEGPVEIRTIAFSPDSQTIFTGQSLWDVSSITKLRRLEESVPESIFSPDGRILATLARHGQSISLWDVTSWKEIRQLERPKGMFTAITFSPDGANLAAANYIRTGGGGLCNWPTGKGTISLWDVATGSMRHELEGSMYEIFVLAFSPDGRTLVSGDIRNGIKFWKMDSGNGPQLR